MFDLNSKIAIVTGGGSGIGSATAQRFARAGAKVIVADIKDCRAEVAAWGGDFRQVDVSEPEQIASLCEYAVSEYGELNIMVNNAAIANGRMMADIDGPDASLRFWRVNLLSVQMGIKEAARRMKHGGAIINLSSITAVRGFAQWAEYGATKGGIVSLTQTAAIEYAGAGIRVNAISAGPVKTLAAAGISGFRKMLTYAEKAAPLRRTVTIEEIGNTAAFLCSDLASGITGETTFVDAGSNIMAMVFDEAD